MDGQRYHQDGLRRGREGARDGTHDGAAAMITWEYAYVFVGIRGSDHIVAGINGQPLDVRGQPQTPWDVLNAMGAEGWEFVTAMPTAPMQLVRQGQEDVPESYWIFYLKRPRGVPVP